MASKILRQENWKKYSSPFLAPSRKIAFKNSKRITIGGMIPKQNDGFDDSMMFFRRAMNMIIQRAISIKARSHLIIPKDVFSSLSRTRLL